MAYATTRLTNPSKQHLVAQLEGRKDNVGRKRDSKGRYTKSGGKKRRKSRTRRRRNPSIKNASVGGVKVYPAAYDALGIIAGAYLSGSFTNFVSRQLVGRLPSRAQGVGYALGGVGTIMAGRFAKKELKTKIPVDYAFVAMSVPLLVEALVQFRMPGFRGSAPPATETESVTATETTTSGTLQTGMGPGMAGMRGSLQPGMLPGGMSGTLQRGAGPGMGRTLLRRVR